jgi:hypothetical protein
MNSRLVLIATALIILSGCASPAKIDQMAISSATAVKFNGTTQLAGNVDVNNVTGGETTNPLWTSEIGDKEFKEALILSLKAAKLLSGEEKGGDHELNVTMKKVDQPVIGLSFTVTSTINYKLTRKADGKELYNQDITASYTAKLNEAFLGVKRLRKANEGSARESISNPLDHCLDRFAFSSVARLKPCFAACLFQ